MTKMKVFLGRSRPDDAPDEHIYIDGFEPWQMMEVINKVKELGVPVNGLGDPDLHVEADNIRLGIGSGKKHDFWSAYYEYVQEVNMFPEAEPVDVTKVVMKVVVFMKKLIKDEKGYPHSAIKAKEHLVLEEEQVAVFANDIEIIRPWMPRGLRGAIVVNTKDGYVDVHSLGPPARTFHAYPLTTAALRGSVPVSGNDRRARCGGRLSMRDLMILFSHLVTCSRTEVEIKMKRKSR
jgi:hypothetical protein